MRCLGNALCRLLVDAGLIEEFNRSAIQVQASSRSQVIQLLYAGGAGNGRGNAGPGHKPRQRNLRGSCSMVACHLVKRIQNAEATLIQIYLYRLAARALAEVGFRAMLTRMSCPLEMPPSVPPDEFFLKPSGVSSSRCSLPR